MENRKVFSVKVEDGREGRDGKPSVGPVYRNLLAKQGYPPPDPEMSTTWTLFSSSVEKYPGNRMLGWRKFVDGKVGPYIWKTYKEVYDEVLHVGSALRASGVEPGCRVGIYGANCPQWIMAMEACGAHSLVCVPLYDTLGSGAVNFIIDHAEVDFVFVQDIKVKELLNPNCKSTQQLKAIVCFTSLAEEDNAKASQMGIKTYSWTEFLHMGKENPWEISPPQPFSICAPLSSEVEEFLRVTCCAFVVQGYGLTETCGACTIGFPDEMCFVGAVGSPAVYNDLRLEEVSDMGYDPLGNPPCGEICVKGKTIFSEYYKNPELTRESFEDGWFHTGDIGQMLPNGIFKVIDRKKNLIKLSQGEYVALEYLENVYGVTPIIDDVWVYGNSFKSMLVAVVVLHEENAKKWAELNGYTVSLSELCSLSKLQNYVLSELKSTADKNKMRGFEYIKGVILEARAFDMERDLVTATLKKKRNNLLKYYQAEIDALYHNLTTKK
uniref:AMP-dependent synthetase/ligase domain-containing protein n=1 Tax=Gossypium raimondii TaxID=29730 RepID=A0A0D2LYU4_GOSRA|nr:hypothetical protein B456_001G145200 [Gossypium raimondii]